MATPTNAQATTSSTTGENGNDAPAQAVAPKPLDASSAATPAELEPAAKAAPVIEPVAPETILDAEDEQRRRTPGLQQSAEAEREDTNSIERSTAKEATKVEPVAIDARVRSEIQRLAAIRAHQRADAERVLENTRTKSAVPLSGAENARDGRGKKSRSDKAASERVPQADDRDQRIPKDVANDFVRVGDKFFHRNDTNRVAFVDAGTSLKTPSSSPELARALVAVAESRSWDGIKVRGSADFRREVFIEATARGVRVVGYTPNAADLAEVQVRVQQYSERNTIERTSTSAQDFRELPPEEAVRRPDLASAVVAADALARIGKEVRDPTLRARLQSGFREQLAQGMERGDTPRPLDDPRVRATVRVPEGVLVEARRDRYMHDQQESENFFVRYRRPDGTEHETWGKGLEEAIKQANAKPGDTIRMERGGAKDVKVVGNVRDEANRVVGKKEIDTHRNEWKVEVIARKHDRDMIPPERSRGR